MKKAQPANFPQFETEMLGIWAHEQTFEQSLQQRQGRPRFSFYDGPPFANGLPHYGHVVALTEKDAITRYKTMRGYYVPRRNGWDTHGLPVEFAVEKQLGISGKRQIVELGIDKFNAAARASVFRYKAEWEQFMTRLGRWSDQEHSYATLDNDYIESVWWTLKRLHDQELVYRGFRSNPYCPRCATPLSNFEVNQNYKDDTPDPSVYVKFFSASDDASFLVWTTTPWTLPANAALAVDADADYVTVELLDDGDSWKQGERLILAKKRLSELELRKAEYKIVGERKGSKLAGTAYLPLYTIAHATMATSERGVAYQVYVDGSVSLEDGTGILHVAPRYGETDLALGQREGLPLIASVDGNGQMVDGFKQVGGLESIAGRFFKDADEHIIADLAKRGRIFAAETFTHTYPFCWRCETPLIYFALETWYIKVAELRDRLVATNNQVNWVPDHIKQGRFGNWLAEARDWNFSRNRFWGAPLPIWVNEVDAGDMIVVGSLDELRELSGRTGDFDLHRPGIDEIVIKRDGKTYRRIEEVFDCWFESGAMPYAQDHWMGGTKGDAPPPHFPAEFIAEGLDQTRGWFYTLHVLATAVFDQPAVKNVIVNGLVLAADGKKLSKRLKNYPDPAEIFNTYGADALRFFFMSSPVMAGEDVRFSADHVAEVGRNVFVRLWNVYSFLATYAEVDDWPSPQGLAEPKSANVLDRWLLARLNQTITEATGQADTYQIARAVRPLRELIDDLSNWYLRRSRRRFSHNTDAADKRAAFATLHYALVRIAQLLAPWSPFVADKLWRELTAGMGDGVPASVHLSDWPEAGEVDQLAVSVMKNARQIVAEGLAIRAESGVKVRQPLAKAVVRGDVTLDAQTLAIVIKELNVKTIDVQVKELDEGVKSDSHPTIVLDTTITPELRREGLARDVVRQIQDLRKQAGLARDDRIELALTTTNAELAAAIKEHSKTIATETLADNLYQVSREKFGHTQTVRLGDAELTLAFQSAVG